MDFDVIGNLTNWGNAEAAIARNFQKCGIEIEGLKSATTRYKGYFQTSAALLSKYPLPVPGDTAWVGAPYPGFLYDCLVAGTWHATTVVPSTGSINLAEYAKSGGSTKTLSEVDSANNVFNVTVKVPLGSGYYNADMARAAVPTDERKLGLIITYAVNAEVWVTERFLGTATNVWENASKWARVIDQRGQRAANSGISTLSAIIGLNKYNKRTDISNFTLANNTGNPIAASGYKHSDYIEVDSGKSYILSGYVNNNVVNRVCVTYDEFGTPISTGWGTAQYSLTSVDNNQYIRSFYRLVPVAQIAQDWLSNGKGELPLPAGTKFIRVNTIMSQNYTETLMVEETNGLFPSNYMAFGINQDNLLPNARSLKHDAVVADSYTRNLYNYLNNSPGSGYLRSGTGGASAVSTIDGLEFLVSSYINIEGSKPYYIDGRKSERPESADTRAVVFYSASNDLLKPCDESGTPYASFSAPQLNGVVYAPANAVKMRFNVKYYSLPSTENSVQLLDGDSYHSYIPFGQEAKLMMVKKNDQVPDGMVMIKKGSSYIGADPAGLSSGGSVEIETDGMFALHDMIAGAVANYQLFQLQPINQIPTVGKYIAFIDGELKFVNDGVVKKINLT